MFNTACMFSDLCRRTAVDRALQPSLSRWKFCGAQSLRTNRGKLDLGVVGGIWGSERRKWVHLEVHTPHRVKCSVIATARLATGN